MKCFVSFLLFLLCLSGCRPIESQQPSVSPAFPDPKPGDGGVLTIDLTATGKTKKYPFSHSNPDFAVSEEDGNEFLLLLCPDDSIPADTDLSGIEVWVYDLVELPTTHSDVREYVSDGVRQYFSDASGVVQFPRGSNVIDIEVRVDTLPAGIGVREHGGLLTPDENRIEYPLLPLYGAQIEAGYHLDDIQINLLSADGETVSAPYSYTPVYTRRVSAPNQVEISGLVRSGGVELPVFHIVDLSGEEEYYKLKKLEQIKLVTEQEQSLLDSFGPYF